MAFTHVALILADHEDVGTEWATERTHLLLPLHHDVITSLAWHYMDTRGYPEDEAMDDAAEDLHGADWTFVNLDKGPNGDTWPSAGDADCWEDDAWLGLADYISHRHWSRLAKNKPLTNYELRPEWLGNDLRGLQEIVEYLTPDDCIYSAVVQRIKELEKS